MNTAQIRSTVERLAGDHPTRKGFKTITRRTILADDDAAPRLTKIEDWLLKNGEGEPEVRPPRTTEPALRPGMTSERVGDHTPGDVVYTISCEALDGD